MKSQIAMKYKFLLTSLLILNFHTLAAQACPNGNPQTLGYMRRDNNRCEGIAGINVGGAFSLISFVTRNIPAFGDNLSLQIPRIGDTSPDISVRSLGKNYQLDDFSLVPNQNNFTFNWPTRILKEANIPTNSLRALASFNLGSQVVYVPVILGQPSGQYEIVLYSSQLVKIPTFEISRNNQVVYRNSRTTPQRGEVVFNWDGRNAPAGRYQLRVVAQLEQYGRPPEPVNRQITFEHNPNWLR